MALALWPSPWQRCKGELHRLHRGRAWPAWRLAQDAESIEIQVGVSREAWVRGEKGTQSSCEIRVVHNTLSTKIVKKQHARQAGPPGRA